MHFAFYLRCNIQGSIVCTNAYVKENASLKDCQVGDSHTIPEKGELYCSSLNHLEGYTGALLSDSCYGYNNSNCMQTFIG